LLTHCPRGVEVARANRTTDTVSLRIEQDHSNERGLVDWYQNTRTPFASGSYRRLLVPSGRKRRTADHDDLTSCEMCGQRQCMRAGSAPKCNQLVIFDPLLGNFNQSKVSPPVVNRARAQRKVRLMAKLDWFASVVQHSVMSDFREDESSKATGSVVEDPSTTRSQMNS